MSYTAQIDTPGLIRHDRGDERSPLYTQYPTTILLYILIIVDEASLASRIQLGTFPSPMAHCSEQIFVQPSQTPSATSVVEQISALSAITEVTSANRSSRKQPPCMPRHLGTCV
ncbi:hypothetical protein PsYK624_122390 [Phanerochaete sordida]|uniref:Uncharacterized protein n=1 Tax=Phanerochaete sordida TaxID=48140 RepID=A0A9P3GJQ8_9APHY|nr:hypothetical protein PsYK624_122390 [Phanerochaete sordida]